MTTLLLYLLMLAPPPQAPPPQAPVASATVKIVCPECNGAGVVNNGQTSEYVTHWDTCPTCHGAKYLEGYPVKAAASDDAAVTSLLVVSETGCAPCLRLATALKTSGMGADYPVWKIRVDHPELVAQYGITAFPTIILLRDGREVARRVGYASPEELKRWADDPSKPVGRGACVEKEVCDAMALDSAGGVGRGGARGAGNVLRPYMGHVGVRPPVLSRPMRYFSPSFCSGST